MLFATLAIVMPTRWMDLVHGYLNLGPFPRSPLVEYLTRSISLLYAIHGGILLVVSRDVARFAPLIRFLGMATSVTGLILLGIDIFAGMPWAWVVFEGPPVALIGVLMLALLRSTGYR